MEPSIVQHNPSAFIDTFSGIPGQELASLGHIIPIQFSGPYLPDDLNSIYTTQRVDIIVLDVTVVSAVAPVDYSEDIEVLPSFSKRAVVHSPSPFRK